MQSSPCGSQRESVCFGLGGEPKKPVEAQPVVKGKVEQLGDKNQIPVPDSIKIPVLDFKNTDIRDVLRALGMQYNVNIYLEPDVKGEISLYLVDISLKDAIDFIVKRQGYDFSVKTGIVTVFKPEEAPPQPPPKAKVIFHKENE